MTWIDIPELQLFAVLFVGFFMGWIFVPKFLNRPMLFALLAGVIFYVVRFIPAYAQLDVTKPGTIPGNGIVSAGILWVIYFFSMLAGYITARRMWPENK